MGLDLDTKSTGLFRELVREVRREFAPEVRVREVWKAWRLSVGLDVFCLAHDEWRREEERGISWIAREASRGIALSIEDEIPAFEDRPVCEETRQWWELAASDLAAAEALLVAGIHPTAVYLCHQTAEKALQAVWVEREREDPPKSHELTSLEKRLSASEPVISAARDLNPEFVVTRYPSATLGSPTARYSNVSALLRLAQARTVVEWARTALPSAAEGEMRKESGVWKIRDL